MFQVIKTVHLDRQIFFIVVYEGDTLEEAKGSIVSDIFNSICNDDNLDPTADNRFMRKLDCLDDQIPSDLTWEKFLEVFDESKYYFNQDLRYRIREFKEVEYEVGESEKVFFDEEIDYLKNVAKRRKVEAIESKKRSLESLRRAINKLETEIEELNK